MTKPPPAPRSPVPPNRASSVPVNLHQVGFLPLLFLTYAYTTGGPFGFEAMFSLSGPGMTMLFLALVPLMYSVPMSLAAAEMNSFMPVQGGFYRWVRAGAGDFWGFQAGWWNWTGTFLMNSAYGVLFIDYLGPYVTRYIAPHVAPILGPDLMAQTALWKWLGAAAFLWLIAWANIRGIEVAGWVAIALQAVILVPVTWFCLAAIPQWQHNPLLPLAPPRQPFSAAFGAGLALAIWIYSGYEQLSSVAGEVKDCRRTFNVVLAWMTPLAILTFIPPMLLGLAALGNWQEWQTGYLTTAAQQIGGPLLGAAMLAASIISVASLSNSTVLSVSRVPHAMAEDGYLPHWLAELHPRYATPARVIVMATMLCCGLAVADVVGLITVYIWARIASSVLTVLAVWLLRRKMPDAVRGFCVPGGGLGMAYAVVVPLAFFAVALYFINLREPRSARFALPLLASGPVVYGLMRAAQRLVPSLRPGNVSPATHAGD